MFVCHKSQQSKKCGANLEDRIPVRRYSYRYRYLSPISMSINDTLTEINKLLELEIETQAI